MDPSTDTLRKLATTWTLAGDEQLLALLETTHKRLIEKCQEANSQLEKMASALDDAGVSLQNVNNQFMALSNCQFVESRVYDDDADVAADPPATKEVPTQPPPGVELAALKRSLSVIQDTHETITILHDTDTESDTDDDSPDRTVLKAKDPYADRPLPYIIGSQAWKSKWHAGLVVEHSDSDSEDSEDGSDEYSRSDTSEPETQPELVHTHGPEAAISDTSSELPSEQEAPPKPTPSDVASEIARRLGAGVPPPEQVEPEPVLPAKTTTRKVYAPQMPIPSQIFPDEPPPLDSEPDDDIFAPLRRGERQSAHRDDTDVFSDLRQVTRTEPVSIFDAGPTPHMFDKRQTNEQTNLNTNSNTSADTPAVDVVKKPVGGISLFGNKGTESIGAAILKRNQRKSSSEEESGSDAPEPEPPKVKDQPKTQKDIFDDLFAKNEPKKDKNNIVKDIKKEIQKKTQEKKDKDTRKVNKVDLFSDNLFDDIDDIFTTTTTSNKKQTIVNKTETTTTKSIFEDDDDLFSEIAAPKVIKSAETSSAKKGLFDSDDELFSEVKTVEKPKISNKTSKNNNEIIKNITPVVNDIPKVIPTSKTSDVTISKTKQSSIFDDEDDIFSDVNKNQTTVVNTTKSNTNLKTDQSKLFNSPSLFDDDDDGDIFATVKPSVAVKPSIENKPVIKPTIADIQHDKPIISNIDKVIVSSTENINKSNENVKQKGIGIEKTDNNFTKPSSKDISDDIDKVKSDEAINISKENNILENSKTLASISTVFENKTEKEVPITETTSIVSHNKAQNVNTETDTIQTKINASLFDDDVQAKSDDEFSEQDFDDLPPIDVKNNEKVTTKAENLSNIFNTSPFEDDIFTTNIEKAGNSSQTSEIISKTAEISDNDDFETNIDTPTNTIKEDPTKSERDSNIHSTKTEKDNNIETAPKSSINTDIFEDIVPEPPVFEKPKEPKKSKNVNALFDDDSDDESLFFKKNDVIFDEKPEDFTTPQDKLLGIFTDEPPDLSKIDDFDDDLFTTLPKPKIPEKPNQIPENTSNNLDLEQDIFNTQSLKAPKNIPADILTDKSNIIENENMKETVDSTNTEILKHIHEDDLFKLPSNSLTKPIDSLNDENLFKTTPKVDNLIEKANKIKSNDLEPKISEDDLFSTASEASIVAKNVETVKKHDKTQNDNDLFNDNEFFTPVYKDNEVKSKIIEETKPNVHELFKNTSDDNKSSDDELFTSITTTASPISKIQQDNSKIVDESLSTSKDITKSDEDLFKKPPPYLSKDSKAKNESSNSESDSKEPKKVGKLKSLSLNINVNALLPGASPKKVKNDQIDGQTQSVTQSNDNDNTINKIISPVSTSPENETFKEFKPLDTGVSFEDNNPGILDNKLSKERAKIQVKRKPSTRRARMEAVRKSGIDFGEDSTDNSSSIDDSPRIKPAGKLKPKPDENKVQNSEKVQDCIDDSSNINPAGKIELNSDGNKVQNNKTVPDSIDSSTKIDSADKIKPQAYENKVEIGKTVEDKHNKSDIDNVNIRKDESIDKNSAVQTNITHGTKDIKSKVVYILNDEDIFNTNTENTTDIKPNENISVNINTLGNTYKDTNEEIAKNYPNFSEKDTKTTVDKPEKDTISKKDKNVTPKDTKSSLFSDNAGDEIFKGKSSKSKSIFDTESDEELFGIKPKKETAVDVKARKEIKEVKGSLFGDDDDDDLFGVAKKKNVEPTPQTSAIKEPPKNTEPVFEDPLSMFGDDD